MSIGWCFVFFVLFNSVSEFPTMTSTLPKLDVKVLNTGEVWWSMPCLLKTFCKIDLTLYPFDTQRCDLEVSITERRQNMHYRAVYLKFVWH